MDNLTINLDVDNKKGNFTQVKAIGAYEVILIRIYNFPQPPDLSSLKAVIYLDDGTALSVCSAFTPNISTPSIYEATLTLGTDLAIQFFTNQKPSYTQDLTIVVGDGNQLYCNTRITVKNNPNQVPTNPQPVTQYFVMEAPADGALYVRRSKVWVAIPDPSTMVSKSDEGFAYDLQGEPEQKDFFDDMTAGEVRVGLITLVKYLKAKGVI